VGEGGSNECTINLHYYHYVHTNHRAYLLLLIWPIHKAPGDSFSTLPYFQLPRDLLPERSGAQKSDLRFGTLSAEETLSQLSPSV